MFLNLEYKLPSSGIQSFCLKLAVTVFRNASSLKCKKSILLSVHDILTFMSTLWKMGKTLLRYRLLVKRFYCLYLNFNLIISTLKKRINIVHKGIVRNFTLWVQILPLLISMFFLKSCGCNVTFLKNRGCKSTACTHLNDTPGSQQKSCLDDSRLDTAKVFGSYNFGVLYVWCLFFVSTKPSLYKLEYVLCYFFLIFLSFIRRCLFFLDCMGFWI